MQFSLSIAIIVLLHRSAMASTSSWSDRILANAARDSIDLSVLSFLSSALADIENLSARPVPQSELPSFHNATRIDTHTHPVPSWFRTLQPLAAGRETPFWDPLSHLQFMSQHSIAHSVLCISTPQANAFPDDKAKTVALARVLNEFSAQLARFYPARFSWMAVTALPYVEETVREVRYAVEELGAVGVGVMTNHDGLYPGEEAFDPLYTYLQERAEKGDGREIVFIHPTDPVIRLDDGRLIDSKPCKYQKPMCTLRCLIATKRHYDRASESSISRPRGRYLVLQPTGPSSIFLICTGASHMVREPSLTFLNVSFLAFEKTRKKRVGSTRHAFGTTAPDLYTRGRLRASLHMKFPYHSLYLEQ